MVKVYIFTPQDINTSALSKNQSSQDQVKNMILFSLKIILSIRFFSSIIFKQIFSNFIKLKFLIEYLIKKILKQKYNPRILLFFPRSSLLRPLCQKQIHKPRRNLSQWHQNLPGLFQRRSQIRSWIPEIPRQFRVFRQLSSRSQTGIRSLHSQKSKQD